MTEEVYQEKLKKVDAQRALLEKLHESTGLFDAIDFVDTPNVYITTGVDKRACLADARQLFDVALSELERYYINHTGGLATVYNVGDVSFIFFESNVEAALKEVSGGKCRVESYVQAQKVQKIICEVSDE